MEGYKHRCAGGNLKLKRLSARPRQGRNWLALIGKHRALSTHVIGGSEGFSMVILRNFGARRYAQCLCADRQLRHCKVMRYRRLHDMS